MSGKASSDRRRKPCQKRSEETVGAILEAAARVFAREGYGATTNRVAQTAGVSIGSLYEYFENKDSLLVELGRMHLRQAEAAVGSLLSHQPAAPELEPLLHRIIDTLLELHERHPGMHETLERVAHRDPELARRATRLHEQLVEALKQALPGDLSPDVGDARARIVVTTLGALVHSLLVPTNDPSTRQLLRDEVFALCADFLDRRLQGQTR